jgi:hypothetical protein
MKRFALIGLLVALVLAVAGCAKPPDAQIQQARQALQVAQAANAEQYAPDAWKRAQSAMDRLNQELAAQAKKLGLFRNYGKAASLAAEVISAASQAATQAQDRVAELRTQTTQAIKDLRASIASARTQLSKLPSTLVNKGALGSALTAAAKLLDTAQSQLDSGQFDPAQATVAQARDSVTSVLLAIEKATGRRPTAKR